MTWEDKNLDKNCTSYAELGQQYVELKGNAEKFKSFCAYDAPQFCAVLTSGIKWVFLDRLFRNGLPVYVRTVPISTIQDDGVVNEINMKLVTGLLLKAMSSAKKLIHIIEDFTMVVLKSTLDDQNFDNNDNNEDDAQDKNDEENVHIDETVVKKMSSLVIDNNSSQSSSSNKNKSSGKETKKNSFIILERKQRQALATLPSNLTFDNIARNKNLMRDYVL